MWATLWPDMLHTHRPALGGAAINTAAQIGAFVEPFGWGLAKDATGTFSLGLAGLAFAVLAAAGIFALMKHNVEGRRNAHSQSSFPVDTAQLQIERTDTRA